MNYAEEALEDLKNQEQLKLKKFSLHPVVKQFQLQVIWAGDTCLVKKLNQISYLASKPGYAGIDYEYRYKKVVVGINEIDNIKTVLEAGHTLPNNLGDLIFSLIEKQKEK